MRKWEGDRESVWEQRERKERERCSRVCLPISAIFIGGGVISICGTQKWNYMEYEAGLLWEVSQKRSEKGSRGKGSSIFCRNDTEIHSRVCHVSTTISSKVAGTHRNLPMEGKSCPFNATVRVFETGQ